MEVETFECTETIEETPAITEEAKKLIEELDLSGQKNFLNETEGGLETRNPYRMIRRDEKFVYEALCPQKTSLVKFNESPVPLRVLQVASHANQFELFKRFEVWSAQGQIKDPVLVAKSEDSDWSGDIYILARWAEMLDSLENLIPKAVEIWREKAKKSVVSAINKAKSDLDFIETAGIQTAASKSSVSYYGFLD